MFLITSSTRLCLHFGNVGGRGTRRQTLTQSERLGGPPDPRPRPTHRHGPRTPSRNVENVTVTSVYCVVAAADCRARVRRRRPVPPHFHILLLILSRDRRHCAPWNGGISLLWLLRFRSSTLLLSLTTRFILEIIYPFDPVIKKKKNYFVDNKIGLYSDHTSRRDKYAIKDLERRVHFNARHKNIRVFFFFFI